MKLLAGSVVVIAVYMAFFSNEDPPMLGPPAQAPDLFAAAATATCPQSAPDQAKAFAADKFDVAEGKRERSPFAPRDGVEAVQLYDVAAACFRAGGDPGRAAEAAADSRQLRGQITQDFRARRVRLEHLLAVGDYTLAKNDVKFLRALLEGKQGRYVDWLVQQNQMLKTRGR
jgi:hypothetical protein